MDFAQRISNELIYAAKNYWECGDIFRYIVMTNHRKNFIKITIHNHLADFKSKYNINNENIFMTNQWFSAQRFDLIISQNLNIAMNDINNGNQNIIIAEILEPGNILKISLS